MTSVSASSCSGENKVVDDSRSTPGDGPIQQKYVYLNSCNATEMAANIQEGASDSSYMSGLMGMVPGLQPFAIAGLAASEMDSNQAHDITIANAIGEGVIMLFEKELRNKDSYMLWTYEGTESQ